MKSNDVITVRFELFRSIVVIFHLPIVNADIYFDDELVGGTVEARIKGLSFKSIFLQILSDYRIPQFSGHNEYMSLSYLIGLA